MTSHMLSKASHFGFPTLRFLFQLQAKGQATHLFPEVAYSTGKFYMNLNYVTEKVCEKNKYAKFEMEYVQKRGLSHRQCNIRDLIYFCSVL